MTDQQMKLNRFFGHVELSSRWVKCTCGNEWCGHFMNRRREIGRDGTVFSDTESMGVKTLCDGTPKAVSLVERIKRWFA